MSLDHILLGLLQQPASGYDLKTTFDGTIRYFWAAELSQTYTTLGRLERKGYLASKMKPSAKGPDRKVYSTTSTGRKILRTWLTSEPALGTERFGYLGQLYFLAAAKDPAQTLWFLTELRKTFVDRVSTFKELETQWCEEAGGDPANGSDDEFHRYLALRSGIHSMIARVEWCDEVIKRLNKRTKQSAMTGKT